MSVELNNLTFFKLPLDLLENIAEQVLQAEQSAATLSIVFVKERLMKQLNKKYRKQDRETDVLAFVYEDGGEIVICPKVVKAQARKFNVAFSEELAKVLIHGILHILGYTHNLDQKAKLMEEKQNYYIKTLWLKLKS